jgi:two-component system OmpR family sensor kinase
MHVFARRQSGRTPRRSLRARLLSAQVGLLALVCLIVGITTTVAIKQFLIHRLDAQVTAAVGRSSDAGGGSPPGHGGPGGGPHGGPDDADTGVQFLLSPGQATGTVGARIVGGKVSAAGVLTDASPQPVVHTLTASQAAGLLRLPVDGAVRTLRLGSLGEYRVLAQQAADGDILVTGLPLNDVNATVYRLIAVELAVAVGGLLAATLAGLFIVRRSLRPLGRVAATATRVTALPLDRGEVSLFERVPPADSDPRTEVGQVATALNHLLGHVGAALAARQASETRVRRFVADASHELRTPLAAIRGYTEFTRREADTFSPDIVYALQRVESEAQRMSGLVDDLLLLARLDSGRALESGEVDLTGLVIDAGSDAAASDSGQKWRLDLPEQAVLVTGDAPRLHQVVANLLSNARAHTPAGTTVTAIVRTEDRHAVLTVHDDGPGIPADLQARIFERFARGDGSRSRSRGSTGLGLAIVDAIVTAHGGTVGVTSSPGSTAFVVRLPLAVPVDGAPLTRYGLARTDS